MYIYVHTYYIYIYIPDEAGARDGGGEQQDDGRDEQALHGPPEVGEQDT